ncbi:substrate-binding periplasmic protein [Ideonella sp.]|uniref:substrate-binding periplasmic protein n=1 Tax=Ideonella sp. TaxID=1929293 RepID=UPI0035B371C5
MLAGIVAWAALGLAVAGAVAKGPTPAASTSAAPCPDHPISVGFYEFGALYASASTDNTGGLFGTGIDVDLVREMQRRSGCRFEGLTMTRARIWSELEAGRLDMTTSGIATPEREKLYAFAPYVLLKHYVWMLKTHAPVRGGLAEFAATPSLRWGAVRGYKHTPAYDAVLEQARTQGRLVEATDDGALLRLLAEGTVDAVIGHSVVMRRYAADHPRKPQLVALDWAPQNSVVPEGMVLSRARFSEAELAYWRNQVREIVRDGTMARIAKRHVAEDEVPELVPRD